MARYIRRHRSLMGPAIDGAVSMVANGSPKQNFLLGIICLVLAAAVLLFDFIDVKIYLDLKNNCTEVTTGTVTKINKKIIRRRTGKRHHRRTVTTTKYSAVAEYEVEGKTYTTVSEYLSGIDFSRYAAETGEEIAVHYDPKMHNDAYAGAVVPFTKNRFFYFGLVFLPLGIFLVVRGHRNRKKQITFEAAAAANAQTVDYDKMFNGSSLKDHNY